ncbi:STAS domain-containing protein [Georgenia thermotolerans]|uniref:Anti-sigma factor antagonist n=1 Tax=Georgenia thermotolerans TaxID=527326 RepID=A0A7J5URH9_9MICO|nr:STAS domain-containing protein [Georgenia thermotolerans]KAE8764937.1 anti-sigma factor antagonist [Georgenia thermotolerans]
MEIDTQQRDGVAVVACTGRLNMVTSPHLRGELRSTVEAGTSRVVVDLSETSFIDSSGLGALIGGLKEARQAGGDLRIAGPGQQILTVLRLTNLDKVLRPYPTVEEALRGW